MVGAAAEFSCSCGRLEVQEPRVRVHGDTAIVTYLTRARGKIAGKAFDGTNRTTRVFGRLR